MRAQTEFVIIFSKIIEHIFFADSVCSNPCVGPLPRIKIYSFLLSIFLNELISTPNIFTFLPVSPLGYSKKPWLSNLIPHQEFLYFRIFSQTNCTKQARF